MAKKSKEEQKRTKPEFVKLDIDGKPVRAVILNKGPTRIEDALQPKELEQWQEFQKAHRGHEFVGVEFVPTGIGPVVLARCQKCKARKDITNYDTW